jgi:hypothetical protein
MNEEEEKKEEKKEESPILFRSMIVPEIILNDKVQEGKI